LRYNSNMKYIARVSEKIYLTENQHFWLIKLELTKPDRISFTAGQYASLRVDERGMRRSYSIASTPDNEHGINLVAEMVPGGVGSTYLQKIKLGEEVEILAPLGQFVIQKTELRNNNLLFVATGSGIVPLWSMINDLLINKHERRQMRLHWGMRSEEDLFWVDNLERLAETYPNFVFDIVLSKPSEKWELCSGHVQDCLMRDFPQGLTQWEAYVCGRQAVVIEIAAKLEELGMKREDIYHEKFS